MPNSVVPPGRVVPANQVWGGNPIKFIRFAKEQ
jgi:carbonic anhydrase/acetyltransferase-like protein (isoleucine patch superfamily)